jgi:hypothetical protein
MAQEKKSFWTTLPGILSGIAAVLTAGGAILAFFLRSDGVPLASWAKNANAVCAATSDAIRGLGIPPDPTSQLQALPDQIRIVTRANQQIQGLARPTDTDAGAKIDRVLALASQEAVAMQNALDAFNTGDTARAQAFVASARSFNPELQQIDGELGANVCALGANG